MKICARTLRQTMVRGERGEFARLLLKYYEGPSLDNLMDAYAVADDANRAALDAAARDAGMDLPQAWQAYLYLRNADRPTTQHLADHFKGLHLLDVEVPNPHGIKIREDEA